VWRLADGTSVGELQPGISVTSAAIGALPDGTPVIVLVSASPEDPVQVRRLADRTPVGKPLWEWGGIVKAVAVGALPDGTPVIVTGSDYGTVRVWLLADGIPVGTLWQYGGDLAEGAVRAVAAGTLPDGTPIVVNGSDDGIVRVWRLADSTPVVPPLELPEPVEAVAVYGNLIVTAAGADIAVHQLAPYNR
jgi:WD40 repeat protein